MNDNGNTSGPSAVPSSQQSPATPAGFWVRGGAWLLDLLIVLLPAVVLAAALGLTRGSNAGKALLGVLYIAYQTIMVGMRGQTIGKMAAGISVVCVDGAPISYQRAFARALLRSLSGWLICIGSIVAVFNPGRITLHDYFTDTRVVYLGLVGKGRKAVMVSIAVFLPVIAIAGLVLAVSLPTLAFLTIQFRCNSGNAKSCNSVGYWYQSGQGNVPKDMPRAAKFYKKACDMGYAPACDAIRLLGEGDIAGGQGKPQAASAASSTPAPGGISNLERACSSGDAAACGRLGFRYEKGNGVQKDVSRAVAFYKQACHGGSAISCGALGFLYHRGNGVEKDETRALAFYTMACDGGDGWSCSSLGSRYAEAADYARAASFYQKACAGKYKDACSNLGYLYYTGKGVRKDLSRAAPLFKQACDGGSSGACHNLGAIYDEQGRDAAAAVLYEKACDGNWPLACYNLGMMYHRGEGVARDSSRELEFYQKACDEGSVEGCAALGSMYSAGDGVEKSQLRATKFFSQACDGGIMLACYNLGVQYEKSSGVDSAAEAAAMYKKACAAKVAIACSNLGNLYKEGRGTKKNSDLAAEMFQRACGLDYGVGCTNLALLNMEAYGIKSNSPRVIALFKKGCEKGDHTGCFNLGALYSNIKNYPQSRIYFARACKMGYQKSCTLLKRMGGR